MRLGILLFAVVALALASGAQTGTTRKKTAAAPAAGGPTKVTGAPTKKSSGLEYWDIKQGTGPEAVPGKPAHCDRQVRAISSWSPPTRASSGCPVVCRRGTAP